MRKGSVRRYLAGAGGLVLLAALIGPTHHLVQTLRGPDHINAWQLAHAGDGLERLVVTVDLGALPAPGAAAPSASDTRAAERPASRGAPRADDDGLADAVAAMIRAGGDPVLTTHDGMLVVADRNGKVPAIPLDGSAPPAGTSAGQGAGTGTTGQGAGTGNRDGESATSDPAQGRGNLRAAMDALRKVPGVRAVSAAGSATVLLTVTPGTDVSGLPYVRAARPATTSSTLDITTLPDDPLLKYAWGLHNDGGGAQLGLPAVADADVAAMREWERTRGSGAVIAVVDTGMDINQPDLAGRVWTNPRESCDATTDSDGDGRIGDCHGWNFYLGTADVTNVIAGTKASRHGTAVAGAAAAVLGNGIGAGGVAPEARIMPLVVGHDSTVYPAYAAQAIRYATDHGADAINLSFGGVRPAPTGEDLAIRDAIRYAAEHNVLVITAAGNDDTDRDTSAMWPASFAEPNMLVVGASAADDTRSSFSAYGPSTVNLFAPGSYVVTTDIDGHFALASGTSIAAPLVTATAAVMRSLAPTASYAMVRTSLLESTDKVAALAGLSSSGGRLDTGAAIGAMPRPVAVTFRGLSGLSDSAPARASVQLLGDGAGLPSGPLQVEVTMLARVSGQTYTVSGAVLDAGPAGTVTTGSNGAAVLNPAGLTAAALANGFRMPLGFSLPGGRYALAVRLLSAGTVATAAQFGVFDVSGDQVAAPSSEASGSGGDSGGDSGSGAGPSGGGSGSASDAPSPGSGAAEGTPTSAATSPAGGSGSASGSESSGGGSGADNPAPGGSSAGPSSGPSGSSQSSGGSSSGSSQSSGGSSSGSSQSSGGSSSGSSQSSGGSSSGSSPGSGGSGADAVVYPKGSPVWGIRSLAPAHGWTSGGTLVTIVGSRLPENASVRFANSQAEVVLQHGNMILVRAPRSSSVGWVNVTVWSGDTSEMLESAFHYGDPPSQRSAHSGSSGGSASGGSGNSGGSASGGNSSGNSGGSASGGNSSGNSGGSASGGNSSGNSGGGLELVAAGPGTLDLPAWMWLEPGCPDTCRSFQA